MKKMSMTLASCAMAMMLTVSGCYAGGRNVVKPSKNYVTEKVSISDIEAIKSSSSVDVVYTQASGTPYAEVLRAILLSMEDTSAKCGCSLPK